MATDVMTSVSAHYPETTRNMATAERAGLLLVAVRESAHPIRALWGVSGGWCREKLTTAFGLVLVILESLRIRA